ncbi:MAG: hypothetical protein M1127_00920 [Patescibacteria group bacterium]|nr:hypothetical protein [Patescibacteria group bacterium]
MTNKFAVSLGGSTAFPNGPDVLFLRKFCSIIKNQIKKGKKFVVVAGGGRLCREYQAFAAKAGNVPPSQLDWVGIDSVRLNTRVLQSFFTNVPLFFSADQRIKSFGEHSLILGGKGIPGHSTDFGAVASAVDLKIPLVINLGKPDYVYTANPDKNKNAKPIENLTWQEYFKIIPTKWSPGMHTPFDPVASRLAQKHKLKVIVAGGADLKNFQNILQGRKFKGTILGNKS